MLVNMGLLFEKRYMRVYIPSVRWQGSVASCQLELPGSLPDSINFLVEVFWAFSPSLEHINMVDHILPERLVDWNMDYHDCSPEFESLFH